MLQILRLSTTWLFQLAGMCIVCLINGDRIQEYLLVQETNVWSLSYTAKQIKRVIVFKSTLVKFTFFLFQAIMMAVPFIYPSFLEPFFPFDILRSKVEFSIYVYLLEYIIYINSAFIAVSSVYMYVYFVSLLEYQVLMLCGKILEFHEKCQNMETLMDNDLYQTWVKNRLLFMIKRHVLLKE